MISSSKSRVAHIAQADRQISSEPSCVAEFQCRTHPFDDGFTACCDDYGAHVKLIDVDTGGKNFDIPSGVEPKGKNVLVFRGRRRVYRQLFDKIPIKNR